MPLPIIILFERTFDSGPPLTVKKLINPLSTQGYDTLALEFPHQKSPKEFESELDETLRFVEKIYYDANELVRSRNVAIKNDLCEMNYSELSQLMMYYVSSRRYNEVAFNLIHLPAMRARKELLRSAVKEAMLVHGMTENNLSPYLLYVNGLSTLVDKPNKNSNETMNHKARQLAKLYKQRKGVIYIGDASSASDLLTEMDRLGIASNVIYYFLHSSRRFETAKDDAREISRELLLANRSFCIATQDDIAAFTRKLSDDITAKAPQSNLGTLADNTNSGFGRFFQQVKVYLTGGAAAETSKPTP
jgi:hypothetical protein